MRLLLDANLSPRLLEPLRGAGHEAIHVDELDLATASDSAIFDRAASDRLVVVTADSDFATLVALRRTTSPSVIQLRHVYASDHRDLPFARQSGPGGPNAGSGRAMRAAAYRLHGAKP